MKVLQLIDTLEVGGAERILVMLANLFYQKGVDVEVLVLTKKGVLAKQLHPEIVINELKRTKRFDTVKMKECASLMGRFDIVHTHLKHNYRYAALVKKRFGLGQTQLVFHDHSHNFGVAKGSSKYMKDWFFKNILKPSFYIGVSVENCQWAKNYLKVAPAHCFLLENVVEREKISEKKHTRQGMVMVSNFTRIKNMEFAIKLANTIKQSLTIYGNVHDKEYFDELRQLVKKLQMENAVTFIHDCINIQAQLYKYEFGIHTSYKETGPLVLIEFMAQGLPFVAHSTGAVYHRLKNSLPTFFVDGFIESSWIKHISEINKTPAAAIEKLYLENYSTQNYFSQCLRIYQEMLRF